MSHESIETSFSFGRGCLLEITIFVLQKYSLKGPEKDRCIFEWLFKGPPK